jgi:signal transduction histidine kinase/FixJ family two-component response regulator
MSKSARNEPASSERSRALISQRAARPDAERADLLSDPDTAEAMYESVRGLAAGLVFIFLVFATYRLTLDDTPGRSWIVTIDFAVMLLSALSFWLLQRRALPVPAAHPLAVALGLLVAANTSASVLLQGEGSDLRYMQAIVIGGGAFALSGRALAVLLIGTVLMAFPVADIVLSDDALLDFAVMQLSTSALSIVLCHGRLRSQRRLLSLRQRAQEAAVDLQRALDRAESEFAERQQTEGKRRELEDQLRQAQKLEALGTLAGGIAHDMNNVLGSITAIASTTLETLPKSTPAHQELADILSAARRGATLTRNILGFARRGPTEMAAFRIDPVVQELESLLQRTLPKLISVRVECHATDSWIQGDAGQLGHLLMNLCLNSADAIDEQGTIVVSTRLRNLDGTESYGTGPGTFVEIAVTDDGHGIAEEILPRVFEPYFSTKSQTEHSGFGLSMVYGTVQQHRGGIAIESRPGSGTRVSVVLPTRPAPSSVPTVKTARVLSVDPKKNLLLFVDDEPLLRRAGERMAKSLGFEAVTAINGRDALEVFYRERARIAAIVLDVAMPVMSGEQCFLELRKLDPALPTVFASGFAKNHDLQALLAEPRTRFVSKPYERESLADALAVVLAATRHADPSAEPLRARSGSLPSA